MTTESYVKSIETFRASLRLYDEQLQDIQRDILRTPIKKDDRIFLLTIWSLD